jgi:hypothetical protein
MVSIESAKDKVAPERGGQRVAAALARTGIVDVVIERAAPHRFIRTFLNREGQPVATGIDELNSAVVPGAPRHAINVPHCGPVVVARADTTSIDREYFEKNTDSAEYERDALPVELNQARLPAGFRPTSGRARVFQLAPGFRIRELWIGE